MRGQVSSYETFFVDDRAVAVLGVLPDEAGRRYLTQRCRVHDSPDVAAYCDPEWERFDPRRHHEMTNRPHVMEMFSHYGGVPPIPALAAALREHFTPTERRQLAGQLAESTVQPHNADPLRLVTRKRTKFRSQRLRTPTPTTAARSPPCMPGSTPPRSPPAHAA